MTKSQQLCALAKSKLGTDFTDDMIVDDEVSCAFAVTTLLHEIDPRIKIDYSTATLDETMSKGVLFEEVDQPIEVMEPGWIVIAATGTNSRPELMPHGHVGIYLNEDQIMSNSSETGLWTVNYNRASWRKRYYTKGGYPVRIYKLKEDNT